MVSLSDIEQAARRIEGQVLRTPCLASRTLSQILGCEVFLKFENLQYTASFKERGAYNKLSCLSADERRRGVVAMSAGNHAQGVAYHAQRLGVRAVIVMPRLTPGVKVERTRGFGAQVILHGDTLEQARAHALQLAEQESLVLVHPYDDAAIIAGQGTVALEMLAEQPQIDTLVVAIGGGGLMAGMATAAKALRPDIEMVGVQVRQFPAMTNAVTGSRHPQGQSTLAEGIAVGAPGRLVRLKVSARDVPGSLAQITHTVAQAGANIDEVHHQRAFSLLSAQHVDIELVLQTRGPAHIEQVIAALSQAGFSAVMQS